MDVHLRATCARVCDSLAYACSFDVPGLDEYFSTGDYQVFTVPTGVTSISVHLWGAGGGCYGSNAGGAGAYVYGTLAVSPGWNITIIVGLAGSDYAPSVGGGAGGASWAGGGNGGGRSALQLWSQRGSVDIAAAGGGGGGGCFYCGTVVASGGAATWEGISHRAYDQAQSTNSVAVPTHFNGGVGGGGGGGPEIGGTGFYYADGHAGAWGTFQQGGAVSGDTLEVAAVADGTGAAAAINRRVAAVHRCRSNPSAG